MKTQIFSSVPLISTVVNEDLIEKIREAQRGDDESCMKVFKNGLSASDRQKGVTLRSDLLRKFNRIIISSNPELKNFILEQFHAKNRSPRS